MNNKEYNKSQYLADFLNELETISEKYGWNVGGYNFETKNWLDVFFIPAIGMDAKNRKF